MTQSTLKPKNKGSLPLALILTLIGLGGILYSVIFNEAFPNLAFVFLFLFGLYLLWYSLRHTAVARKFGKPELTISQEYIRVGQRFTANLANTFPQDVTINKMSVQLIFRETATYQQGTDTRTVTHENVVQEHELMGGVYRAGNFLQKELEFQIPPDAMHTLRVRRNMLQWFVSIKAEIANYPDLAQESELEVISELQNERSDF